MKSTDLPDGADLNTAARAGLVDPVLGSLAASIARVGWINLRRAPHELVRV